MVDKKSELVEREEVIVDLTEILNILFKKLKKYGGRSKK